MGGVAVWVKEFPERKFIDTDDEYYLIGTSYDFLLVYAQSKKCADSFATVAAYPIGEIISAERFDD